VQLRDALITGENHGRAGRCAYDAHVRAPLAGLLCLAACYTPEIPTGIACAPNGLCPEGQACIDRMCVIPGLVDAAVDAELPDKDGDRVPDMTDNCPDDANADQDNEDKDKFGDACDPCPAFADDTPRDQDRDGVADACDPNPMLAGDDIELFEGFHKGLPDWMRTGTWTAADDSIAIDAPAETAHYMIVPASATDRVQVFASVEIDTVATAVVHFFEVSLPNDAANNLGIGCEVFQPEPASGRYLSLWDGLNPTTNLPPRPPGRELGQTTFAWDVKRNYVVSLKRVATTYSCRVTSPDGAVPLEALGSSSSGTGLAAPTVVIRARSLAARVLWVMVVRSP
jgi:hypothetical protein